MRILNREIALTAVPRTESATKDTLFVPPPITRLEDTGLSLLWLQDLALKIFYFQSYHSGFKAAEEIALPFAGIVDQILDIARYLSTEPATTKEMIDRASQAYFVDI